MPTKSKFENIKEFFRSNEKAMKIILVSVLVIFFLILVAVAFDSLKKTNRGNTSVKPTPTPPQIQDRPSAYANDPEVLASEQDINQIDKMLSETNLQESAMLPPKIDLKVEIKEN